jgi:hypothetical protein
MNYAVGQTIHDGYAKGPKARALERQFGTLAYERLPARSDSPSVRTAHRAHGKSENSSLGDTERALANFTIFSKATFRSPRSTPPM